MKIRHVLPGFGVVPADLAADGMSGIVGVAYNLARQQAVCRHAVELFGLCDGSQPAGVQQTAEGVTIVPVRARSWLRIGSYDYRYFGPAALQLWRRGRSDVQHVYSNPYLLAPSRAEKRVLHYQTPVGEVPAAYQKAVQKAGAVICCSNFIRDQFLEHVTYPAASVFVVYNGVDLDHFRPGDKQASRARLGIPADDVVILFAGQVNEEKGLLHLVRACRHLAPDNDVRLVVAGSSALWGDSAQSGAQTPYERQVATEAENLKTTFLGKVAHGRMPIVYQAADVFVCPSVWDEPFGMVNLEAMATELPVVASRAGGIPEAIANDETGFLVPASDAPALAGALRRLLDNPTLRREMGQAGRRRAHRYSWGTIAAQVESIYDSRYGNDVLV